MASPTPKTAASAASEGKMHRTHGTASSDGPRGYQPLSEAQKDIIKSTVPILAQHGVTITKRFYENILTAHPELNTIFNTANQSNGAQPRALAGSLYAYASNIDDLAALSAAVELIANKHASLYVRPEHYTVVGTYLLGTMKEILGDALTTDVAEAWESAYWQIAGILIDAEQKLYEKGMGWTDWREFRIVEKAPESDEITSFYLEPVGDVGKPLPSFLPGQYVSIRTEVPALGRKQPRQYSLSDAPNGKYYRISIKREDGVDAHDPEAVAHPGFVSNLMHADRHEGDIIEVSHPYGGFHLDVTIDPGAPVVFLSAGVGITPLLSMFNTLLNEGATRPITFAHGAKATPLHAFAGHLQQSAEEHGNVKVLLFSKAESNRDVKGSAYHRLGRLEIPKLDQEELFIGDRRTQYFTCGPQGFMSQVIDDLKSLGVDNSRIHAEQFGPSS